MLGVLNKHQQMTIPKNIQQGRPERVAQVTLPGAAGDSGGLVFLQLEG